MSKQVAALIVEDEKGVSWALDRLLRSMGYDAVIADNGQCALELIAQRAFGFALVDVKLPDMDGTELETGIHKAHPDLPIILISGYIQEDDGVVQEWIKAGRICDFIGKPFEHADVRKAIERTISLFTDR